MDKTEINNPSDWPLSREEIECGSVYERHECPMLRLQAHFIRQIRKRRIKEISIVDPDSSEYSADPYVKHAYSTDLGNRINVDAYDGMNDNIARVYEEI